MNEAMQIWTWKRLNWAERAVASVWRDWITRTIQSKRLIWECKETIYHDDDAETYVPLGSFGINGPQLSELIGGQGLLGINGVDQRGGRGVGGVASPVTGATGFQMRRLGYGTGPDLGNDAAERDPPRGRSRWGCGNASRIEIDGGERTTSFWFRGGMRVSFRSCNGFKPVTAPFPSPLYVLLSLVLSFVRQIL